MTRSNLDGLSINQDTWANLPSADTNQYRVITVTGLADSQIDFTSNGTEWVPVNGQCTLELDGTPYGIMPSGTISAVGTSQFVSGTALPHTYSVGIWMYFAATAVITPALSAGFYWCVFSNTTTCTIYTNGPGSAAYDFSVGGATTGHTSEVTARTVTIPAGLMGTHGQLEATVINSHLNSASTKTTRVKLGGNTFATNSPTTTAAICGKATIANTSAAVQMAQPTFGYGASSTGLTRLTVDTTAATTCTQTLQMAAATDYIISNAFRLDLYNV